MADPPSLQKTFIWCPIVLGALDSVDEMTLACARCHTIREGVYASGDNSINCPNDFLSTCHVPRLVICVLWSLVFDPHMTL